MPSVLAFDTHVYVKKLRDAGVPEEQAEIQVEAIAAIIDERMATKQDLELHKTEIQRDIKELETRLEVRIKELETRLDRDIMELKRDIKRDIKELGVELETRIRELEMRLLIRLGGLLAIAVGAIATLIKLL